jgi:small subunit ribosomal protein S10
MAVQKVRVRLRGYDIELLDQAAKSIVAAVKKTGAKYSGPIPLPTKINKFTVLRSVHVNVKSREQFEMRTHKRLIDIEPADGTLEAMMKLELAAGVDVDIKQY